MEVALVMSTLQNQITQSLEGLSDDSLRFILDMIQRFVLPAEAKNMSINCNVAARGRNRRLGSMKGQRFIADGYDIDECNDEIARLFEVDDTGKEDYEMVINHIQFLSEKRKKEHKISIEKNSANNSEKVEIKLGLFNGMRYIADEHDIDECNDEIAEMFGVND